MKNKLVYIIIFFLLISCKSDMYKSQLVGSWYFYNKPENPKDLNELNIYRDSIIINDFMGRTSAKWNATENQIYLYDIKGFHSRNELNYDYKLKANDLLYLKVYGDTIVEFDNIIKAENPLGFLQKSMDLQFELPKKDTQLIEFGKSRFNFYIYAGYKNGKLKFRTDYSTNLNNLENEISLFKNELKPSPFSKTRYILIADKNIRKNKLDSLKRILDQTTIQRIFRVFKNDNIDYKNNLTWYGDTE